MTAAAPCLSAPAAFVDSAFKCFQQAAARTGGARDRFVRLGEHTARLSFAGSLMEDLMFPALAHLEVPPCETDLVACFFDSESAATPMPPPPWSRQDFTEHGEIAGFNDGCVHVTYGPGVDILNCLDCERGLAVYWAPTWRSIPSWERSFPLRPVLNWWLKSRPFQPIHAGAVGYPDGGVLVVGGSGSGKSTVALACLDSDLGYAGDDYVLVRTEPEPRVYSLYNTAKLEADNLVRFPWLQPHLDNPAALATEKALVFLHTARPGKLSLGFPVRAILCPRVTGRHDTVCRPASARDAFLAIAPTTAMHLPGARRQTVEKLFRLAKSVPCYLLESGTDIPQIPRAISRLLSELR